MKFSESIKNGFKNLKGVTNKYAPEILAGTGIGLWIVSSVNAVLATPKAYADIQKKKEHLTKPKLTVKETVTTVGKYYAGPLIGAALGTGCIITSVTTSNKRYLALSSAYEFANETFQIYKEKVVETVGEKKEKAIQDKVAEERLNRNPKDETTQVIVTGNGESLCYDSFSGRYFKFNIGDIKAVENQINADLINFNYVSLNDLYSHFGLENIDLGYSIGWSIDTVPNRGLLKLNLSSKLTKDNTPCLVIDYNVPPQDKYEMFG